MYQFFAFLFLLFFSQSKSCQLEQQYIGDIPTEIKSSFDQLKDPKKYDRMNVSPCKAFILYGPSNNGKNFFVRKMAECYGVELYEKEISHSYRLDPFFSQTQDTIKNNGKGMAIILLKNWIFAGTKNNSLDYCSTFLKDDYYLNATIDFFDKLNSIDPTVKIVFFLTVNSNNTNPLFTSNKNCTSIRIDNPNETKHKELINYFSTIYPTDKRIKADYLMEMTKGWSSGNIYRLFNTAGYIALGKDLKERSENCFSAAYRTLLSSENFHLNQSIPKEYIGEIPKGIQDIMNVLQNPSQYKIMGIQAGKISILYGPKGIGKSHLIHTIADKTHCFYFSKQITFALSLAEEILQIQRTASTGKYTLLHLNHLRFPQSAQPSCSNPITTFQRIVESLDPYVKSFNFFVVIAIDSDKVLPSEVMNSGYEIIKMEKLDTQTRKKLIEYFSSQFPTTITSEEIDILTKKTENWSNADIKKLYDCAGTIAINKNMQTRDKECLDEAYNQIIVNDKNDFS